MLIDSEIHSAQVENIRYLGVTIDQQLKWDERMKNLTKSIKVLLFKFEYLRAYLNKTNMCNYKSAMAL